MNNCFKWILTIVIIHSSIAIYSQGLSDSVYHERLFYTCKAWGHFKYYHSEVANGNVNWDEALIEAIDGIKESEDNTAFNNVLLTMFNKAGETVIGTNFILTIPDSLNNNLDRDWIYNSILSDSVQSVLDTISQRFAPQYSVLVPKGSAGQPAFSSDDTYYSGSLYPEENIRLLGLFRYWNIIHYFFPYKSIMDQNWDSTLMEFIPIIAEANNALNYHLAFKQLTTRIVDSHASFISPLYFEWLGGSYPPFSVRYLENEMVITKVLNTVSSVKVGDVVKKIDGHDIYLLRDSLRRYTHGSNDIFIENQLNKIIMYGNYGVFSITVDDGNEVRSEQLVRNTINDDLLSITSGPIWRDSTLFDNCNYGIVDMGRLNPNRVGLMFEDLWDSEVIVFDVRNYPNSTISNLLEYLVDSSIQGAKFTAPSRSYPGALYWFSQTKNGGGEDLYRGKIIILFDERTISHAEFTCMYLERVPASTKIGSQTAGADGNVSSIYLPGRIRTNATFLGTYYPDYTATQRIGIVPDYIVEPTIKGIREGRDEVLDFALTCDIVSSIEPEPKVQISIYPNPTNNELRIEMDGDNIKSFQVFDVQGKKIIDKAAGSETMLLNVSGLQTGIYYVNLTGQNQNYLKMFYKN
ncbi:T9SS type A sorting domain-containing protein [bacterium]|nr:T9SS type A sorting domain-containing protein [bacterium]